MKRLSFTLVMALAVAALGRAQSFTRIYAAGNQLLQFENIAAMPDGGWVAVGMARDSNNTEAFIARFDAAGNLLWSQQPEYTRNPRALVVLDNGDILVFNTNSGFQSYFDASTLHLAPDGSVLFETIWGTSGDQDDWFDAVKLPDGSVVAIGMSRLDNSFSERVFLAKFSPTGVLTTEKVYDANTFGRFYRVIALPSGDFYALGQEFAGGTSLGLIGKFTTDGDLEWIKRYDFAPAAVSFGPGVVLSDGSLFVAAIPSFSTAGRLYLLNFDPAGNLIGQSALEGPADLAAIDMHRLANDTVAIVAASSGQVFPVIDNDNILLRVTPTGQVVSQLAFGSTDQDFPFGAFFTGTDMLLCGMTDSSADGTARRAFISRSGFTTSCCAKPLALGAGDPLPDPAVTILPVDVSFPPAKIIQTTFIGAFPLTETTSCQDVAGVDLLPDDTTLCTGALLTLQVAAGVSGNFVWSTGATGPSITVSTPGLYAVELAGDCGTARDTINVVSVGAQVDVEVVTPLSACAGEPVTLSASGGSTYQWLNAAGALVGTSASVALAAPISGVYRVIASDGQCRDTAAVDVDVLPGPAISAGPDLTANAGQSVQLQATGAVSYSWLPADGLSCSNCANPVATLSDTTTFIVTGTDANGCTGTDTVRVTVRDCTVEVPNAFTPNGDAMNDLFRPVGDGVDTFALDVYNRWGQLVFTGTAGWDGRVDGLEAPADVYTFRVEVAVCGEAKAYAGGLTLLR